MTLANPHCGEIARRSSPPTSAAASLHPGEQRLLGLQRRGLRGHDAHDHERAVAKLPDRLEAAVAANVVPLHQERVVGQLTEDPLRDGLQRPLAHPGGTVVPSTDVEPSGHVGRHPLEDGGIGDDSTIHQCRDVETRSLERPDTCRIN